MDMIQGRRSPHDESVALEAIRDVVRIAQISTNAVFAQLCVGPKVVAWSGQTDEFQPVLEFITIAELHSSGAIISLEGGLPSWAVSMQSISLTGPHAEPAWLLVVSDNEGAFDEKSTKLLEIAGSLAERSLDRTVEHERLADVSEELRVTQADLRVSSQQLEISNRELEQFAYVASHELVSPLRAVSVYAQLLQQILTGTELQPETTTKVESCVDEITRGVSLMSTQVQSLLELSSVNATATTLEPVELSEAVGNALDTLAPQLEEAEASVTVGTLPIVLGQLVPLQGVFANLVSNSLRYSHADRQLEIEVSASTTATHTRVTVRDNGVGVTEADADRIFGLFERASTTTDGTGIGLALSRRIVESFGGRIGVTSGIEEGSEFWVELSNAATWPVEGS